MGLYTDFEKHKKFARKLSASVASILLIIVTFPLGALLFNVHMKMILLPAHVYQLIHNHFYTSQFICAAFTVRERFKSLNSYLRFKRNIKVIQELKTYLICSSSLNIKTHKNEVILVQREKFNLRKYEEIFNELCDIIDTINALFTFHLIIVSLNIMIMSIFAVYGIVRELLEGSDQLWFLLPGNSIWMIIQYMIQHSMVNAGSSTTSEAEKATLIVVKAAAELDSRDYLRNDLNSLLLHMRSRNKKLKNIFFTVDWNLTQAVSVHNNIVEPLLV